MYADNITESMDKAIKETKRRREIQEAYNKKHGIIPKTIEKEIREVISNVDTKDSTKPKKKLTKQEKMLEIERIETEMKEAAKNFDFERAMELRNALFEMKSE